MSFQVGSSLLDACVLGVLSQEDSYGYNLTQSLKEVITISDSTLYPVLRRLKNDGSLDTYDQSYQGRNRRYYALTTRGEEQLALYLHQWAGFKKKVDTILAGGIISDQR